MEAIVARVGDFKDGDMKEVQVGETKVLLYPAARATSTPWARSAPTMAGRWPKGC